MTAPKTRADLDLDEIAQDLWSIEAVIDAIMSAVDNIPTNALPYNAFSLARLAKGAAGRLAGTFSDVSYREGTSQEKAQ